VTLATILAHLVTRWLPHSETPGLEAQVLLAHALQKPRAWVLAHPEYELTTEQATYIEKSASRRLDGEPLPYILGHWEFFGLDFIVTSAVLIPRPETELLVERALGWLRRHPESRTVIDVGAGSGCIAIALAKNVPDLQVLASDLSQPALEIAQQNAELHQVSRQISFIQANLLEFPKTEANFSFDLIVANLPYIPRQSLHRLPIYSSEPTLALDGGEDGLDLIRRLLEQAPSYLTPQGCLMLEIEAGQGIVARALAQSAFQGSQVQVLPDLAGHDRLIEADLSVLN
jgi:release factor glutamine methyltransferase